MWVYQGMSFIDLVSLVVCLYYGIHRPMKATRDWWHTIEVKQAMTFEDNFPVRLEGWGFVPPEDVCGIHGQGKFLRIIANEDDPDREDTLACAKSQGYKEFDIGLLTDGLQPIDGVSI